MGAPDMAATGVVAASFGIGFAALVAHRRAAHIMERAGYSGRRAKLMTRTLRLTCACGIALSACTIVYVVVVNL